MGNLPSTGSGRTDAGGDARAPRMMPTNPVSEYGTCLGQVHEQFVAATSLSIPGIIAAETSLSFLGLGIQRPAIIWGGLLAEAQNLQPDAEASWLMVPGFFALVAILALNLMGDGIRDAADPYSTCG